MLLDMAVGIGANYLNLQVLYILKTIFMKCEYWFSIGFILNALNIRKLFSARSSKVWEEL
jgi:hypothetical protein